MRKQLKLLLLVATVLVLFAMAMIVGSAAEVTVTDETSLKNAISSVQDNDVITVTQNITLSAAIELNQAKSYTLQGANAGVTISCTAKNALTIKAGKVTLKNITITSSGGNAVLVVGTSSAVIKPEAYAGTGTVLVVEDGATLKSTGSTNRDSFAIKGDTADIYVNGGTFYGGFGSTSGGTSITAGARFVINDGTVYPNPTLAARAAGSTSAETYLIHVNKGGSSITINGGTFDLGTASGKCAAIMCLNQNNTSHTITGGTFIVSGSQKVVNQSNVGCKLTISGGTFELSSSATLAGTSGSNALSITITKGTFDLSDTATMGDASAFTVKIANKGDVVATYADTNTAAKAFFAAATWDDAKINDVIRSESAPEEPVEEDKFFSAFLGNNPVLENVTFAEAYQAVKGGTANTIVLTDNATILGAVTLDANVIINGNGKTLTLAANVFTGWMFTVSAAEVSFNNITLEHNIVSDSAFATSGLFKFIAENGHYELNTVTANNAAEVATIVATGVTLEAESCIFKSEHTQSSDMNYGVFVATVDDSTLKFTDCTLETTKLGYFSKNALILCRGTATLSFDDCTVKTATTFVYVNYPQKSGTVTITGETTVEAYIIAYLRYGGSLIVGTESGEGDDIELIGRLLRANGSTTSNAIAITVYNGKIVGDETHGMVNMETSGIEYSINIYGGTFIQTAEGMFGAKADSTDLKGLVITIKKGTFELSNGATLFGPAVSESNVEVDPDNEGDIAFKLGAGTAETAASFFAKELWIIDAGAFFYITGWNASEAGEIVPAVFTTSWTGTLTQYKAQYCPAPTTPDAVYGSYVDGDEIPMFITAEYAEAGDYTQNFFVDESIATGAVPVVPFTVNGEGITVTLTNWDLSFAGTLGTVTNGTLVLENCNVIGTEAGTALFVVNGEKAALEVNGGVYDVAGLANTIVFQIGAESTAQPNSYATFNGVTIWLSTGTTNAVGIHAYQIGTLTVEDCLFTPYKGVEKGKLEENMPATAINGVGLATYATKTYIKNTDIYGGNSGAEMYLYAGDTYVTGLTAYGFSAVSVNAGATLHFYDGYVTSAPTKPNCVGITISGGVANVYGGTFVTREGNTNGQGAFGFRAVNGKLNIYDGSFTDNGAAKFIYAYETTMTGCAVTVYPKGTEYNAYDGSTVYSQGVTFNKTTAGSVFSPAADWTVNVTGATFNVTAANVVIVKGTATAADKIAFTDCVFKVTAAQTGTLFEAATFKGKNLVVAPEGTKVTDTVVLDFAQTVQYAGASYKLYATYEGAFINGNTSVSLYTDTEESETSGLMFYTQIAQSVIEELKSRYEGAELRYYTLVAPMDYVAAAQGVFTKDALGALGFDTPYIPILARRTLDTSNGVAYSGALVDLQNSTRLYAAVAMVEIVVGGVVDADGVLVGGEVKDTVYSTFDSAQNVRSAKQIAEKIIADTESFNNDYTDEQQAIIKSYAGQ